MRQVRARTRCAFCVSMADLWGEGGVRGVQLHTPLAASNMGSIGKNGTSNFTNASEWAWHVESRAWYAEFTGYTATTYNRGRQTFLDRGLDESQTSLSRAGLEKKSQHIQT